MVTPPLQARRTARVPRWLARSRVAPPLLLMALGGCAVAGPVVSDIGKRRDDSGQDSPMADAQPPQRDDSGAGPVDVADAAFDAATRDAGSRQEAGSGAVLDAASPLEPDASEDGGDTEADAATVSDAGDAADDGDAAAVADAGDAVDADPGTADAAPVPVDCTAIEAAGVAVCHVSEDACGAVFDDYRGCTATCAAAGLVCATAYNNVDDACAPNEDLPALPDCDSGHESDYCDCRTAQ